MRYLSTLIVLAVTIALMTACNGGDGSTPTSPTYPSGKPTGVTVDTGDRSATISWNPVGGASGYYVYISYDGTAFNRYGSGLVETISVSVYDLTNGKTYYFGVSAVGSGGWESSIAYPGGNPTANPVIPTEYEDDDDDTGLKPPAPQNLQGVAKDSACELYWDPISIIDVPDFAYYCVYRKALYGDYSTWPLIKNYLHETNYRDADLNNEISYSYRVTSVDTEALESIPSNHVSLTPQDFAPEKLQNMVLIVNPGRIILEWTIPLETDIEFYAIERVEGIDPSGAEIIIRFLITKPVEPVSNPKEYADGAIAVWRDIERNVIVVRDGAVFVGTKYTYRISAIDEENQEGQPTEIIADKVVP